MATEKPDDDLPYLYGDDGWPLGGPSDAVIERVAEARFRRDFQAALDRLQGGDLSAFTEAMWLCWRHDPDGVPYRLVEASEALVERAMSEDDKREQREQRARRKWRDYLVRWELVAELLERWPELSRAGKANLERARELIAKTTDRKKRARLVELLPEFVEAANDDRGTTVDHASEAIAKGLKETDARGRARKVEGRTVRATYELVERLGGKAATFEGYQRDLLRRRGGKRD